MTPALAPCHRLPIKSRRGFQILGLGPVRSSEAQLPPVWGCEERHAVPADLAALRVLVYMCVPGALEAEGPGCLQSTD